MSSVNSWLSGTYSQETADNPDQSPAFSGRSLRLDGFSQCLTDTEGARTTDFQAVGRLAERLRTGEDAETVAADVERLAGGPRKPRGRPRDRPVDSLT